MVRNIEVQNTFSGPLDLLLYLVRRDEIDIHDIPVGHVTREYLVELNKMQEIDVDAGGEFLSMASMLTEIKGRMLLPDIKEEENDEEEIYDPRQGLVEALLEYKKFKEVAAELEAMSDEFGVRYSRAVKEPEFQAVVKEKAEELGALDLLAAFQRIARRMLNERAPREIVSEEVPTEIRIKQIEEVVRQRGRVSFSSILSDSPSEDEMVGFFIAMLELIRMRKIEAQQAVDFSEIYFIPNIEDKLNVQELEEEVLGFKSAQVKNSISYIRVSKYGLSNTFGITQIKKVNTKANKYLASNRFDTLSFCKNSKNGLKKAVVKSADLGFPPLLKRSLSGKQVYIEVDKVDATAKQIVDLGCALPKDTEVIINNRNSSVKLSNIFMFTKRRCIVNKEEISQLISNAFDMLLIKSIQAIPKYIRVNKFLAFVPLISGRLRNYIVAPLVSCEDIVEHKPMSEIALNNNEIKESMQIVACRSKYMPILFGLKRRLKLLNNVSRLDRIANIFGLTGLKKNGAQHLYRCMKYNSLKFMNHSTGKVSFHSVSDMKEASIQGGMCTKSINPVVTSDVFVARKVRRLHAKLSTPFIILVKSINTDSDLKNINSSVYFDRFNIFKFKRVIKKTETSLLLRKSNGFMKVGFGKVILHRKGAGVSQKEISNYRAIKHAIQLNKVLHKNNKVKYMSLSSPFSISYNYQSKNNIVAEKKFDMLVLKHKQIDKNNGLKNILGFLPLCMRYKGKHLIHDSSEIYSVSPEIVLAEDIQRELGNKSRLNFKLSNALGTEIPECNRFETSGKSFDFMALPNSKGKVENGRVVRNSFLKL